MKVDRKIEVHPMNMIISDCTVYPIDAIVAKVNKIGTRSVSSILSVDLELTEKDTDIVRDNTDSTKYLDST